MGTLLWSRPNHRRCDKSHIQIYQGPGTFYDPKSENQSTLLIISNEEKRQHLGFVLNKNFTHKCGHLVYPTQQEGLYVNIADYRVPSLNYTPRPEDDIFSLRAKVDHFILTSGLSRQDTFKQLVKQVTLTTF